MNFFYIENRWNFLIVDEETHKMLTGGTKVGETNFKDFLYKLVQHIPPQLEEGYIGDGILVRKIDFKVILNVKQWNNQNFKQYSEALYDYVTTKTKNDGYSFIALNEL